MSVAGSEAEDAAVSATALLTYDQGQLVHYLKGQDRGQEFDISSLTGVASLSRSQRDELAQKLGKAALLLPLELDELQARLENVASTRRGSRQRSDSIASTPPLITVQDLEIASRRGLIEDGGCPACSVQELSHILAAPMARYKAVQSWLSDEPDTETGAGELKTVFSRQFMRWWNFRKSQWDIRGLGNSEVGFSAFLEASKRKYEGMGAKAMVAAPSFDETIQRQWQYMPASQPVSSGQTFSAYSDAVKKRLAPYRFIPPPQLKDHPQKQTAWTDWLEYLSFELGCLETLTLAAEPIDSEFHQSMRRLRRARRPNGNDPTQRPLGGKGATMAKELAAAQADRGASQKSIDNFIRETGAYTRARRAAFYQRHRVEWAIKEARLMESERSLQRDTAKSKKRKQRDEAPSESQAKRTTQRAGSENASHPRRSTLRSANLTGTKD
ncbi:hypothetical protein ACQKWADRAFT_142096 [Trichoderma austrokoningii]